MFPITAYEAELPKTTPEVIRTSVPSVCNDFRSEVEKYDWDDEIALQIMDKESGCDSSIVNNNPATGDYSVGLYQINLFGDNAKSRPPEEELKIPEKNIQFAYNLYKKTGFTRSWSVCVNGQVNCKGI